MELAPLIEATCTYRHNPDLIVDVGAAEGYYAVGLALRKPSARVIAFEMEDLGRERLREAAELNYVSGRIDIRGKCEAQDLEGVLGGSTAPIVVCDVEGYEAALLDPITVPSLRRATILVELHEFICSGITGILQARFDSTHHIRHVPQQPRSREQFPWRTFGTLLLPKSYLDWVVSEWRPVPMSWLWMEPRSRELKTGITRKVTVRDSPSCHQPAVDR
jgi:hypothetical protein